MSIAENNQGKPGLIMHRFGPALQHMPLSTEGFDAHYPLDDPLMSDQLAFFQQATKIHDPQELKAHILAIRDECCETFPFPCILWYDRQTSFYPSVRKVIQDLGLNSQKILLDIGAGMGTDLRQIISHGWNRDDVLSLDITNEWQTLGHKLFRDSDQPIPNLLGDIFNPDVLDTGCNNNNITEEVRLEIESYRIDLYSLKNLNPLKGRVKFLILNQVFHLFDEVGQKNLAERCALLLSNEPGSAIFGMQMGGYTKGLESKVFVHSRESWKNLWHSTFGSIKVQVNAQLVDLDMQQKLTLRSLFPTSQNIVRLYWSVVRI